MTESMSAFRAFIPEPKGFAPSEATQQLQVLSATNANAPALALAYANQDRQRQQQYMESVREANTSQQALAKQKLTGDMQTEFIKQAAPQAQAGINFGAFGNALGVLPESTVGIARPPAEAHRVKTMSEAYSNFGKGFNEFAQAGQAPIEGTERLVDMLTPGALSKIIRPGDQAQLDQAAAAGANTNKVYANPIIGGIPTRVPLTPEQEALARGEVDKAYNSSSVNGNRNGTTGTPDGVTSDAQMKRIAEIRRSSLKTNGGPQTQRDGSVVFNLAPGQTQNGRPVTKIIVGKDGSYAYQ